MKVFVLKERHSDGHGEIISVCDSLEKAQKSASKRKNQELRWDFHDSHGPWWGDLWGYFSIEEFELT